MAIRAYQYEDGSGPLLVKSVSDTVTAFITGGSSLDGFGLGDLMYLAGHDADESMRHFMSPPLIESPHFHYDRVESMTLVAEMDESGSVQLHVERMSAGTREYYGVSVRNRRDLSRYGGSACCQQSCRCRR